MPWTVESASRDEPTHLAAVNIFPAQYQPFAGYPTRVTALDQGSLAIPINLNIRHMEDSRGPLLEFELDRTLFSGSEAERFMQHYQRLLASCLNDPDQLISRSALLSAAERVELDSFHTPPLEYDRPTSIPAVFEAIAAETPTATAVYSDDGHLDFGALNRRANQLAHHLLEAGISQGDAIGIHLNRSPDLMIAILAVFKARGVYVPLAAQLPKQRAAFILRDAKISWVISRSPVQPWPGFKGQIFKINEIGERLNRTPTKNPGRNVDPQALAYIIYTSGSTGQPKGVAVSHGAVLNFLLWAETYLDAGTRMMFKASISFDVSIHEMFSALLQGGAVVIASELQAGGKVQIELINRYQVTHMAGAASVLRLLIETGEFASCTSLRRIFVGSEVVPPALVADVFELLNDVEVVNAYGPTETAIGAILGICTRSKNARIVPIGQPIPNIQVRLLDRHLQSVARGVPGQLFISGPGLGQGYLNRPGETAASFLPDPYAQSAGTRMYATGDRARYRTDGQLEFLGRSDYQIQLRGYRIELGEIEAQLGTHPEIERAVVRIDAGQSMLNAYIAVRSQAGLELRELRDQLAAQLPGYKIPAHFYLLDRLPQLTNGKTDRRALGRGAYVGKLITGE